MRKKLKENELIRVLSFMKPNIMKCIISMIVDSGFTSICYNIVLAYIIKDVINAITYGNILLIKRAFFIAIVSFSIAFIFQPLFRYSYKCCIRKTMGNIRMAAFKHMEALTVKNFEGRHTGDLITRMTNDIDAIQEVYMNHMPMLTFAFIHGTVAVISMLLMNWQFAIIVIFIGLVSVLISSFFSKPLRKAGDNVQTKMGGMTQRLIDISDGFIETKMFNIEEKIFDKYENENRDLNRAVIKRGNISSALEVVNSSYGTLKTIGILALGLYMSMKGEMDVGTIAAMLHLQGNASYLFENIGQFIAGIQGSLAGASRVFELFNSPTESDKNKENDESNLFSNSMIEMKEVCYSYDDRERVLDEVNISVEKGQMAAIVGASGGGKSTLIKLLMGFYNVDNGGIFIDGCSIASKSLKELREIIAYVPQDSYLFYGTIEENIRYGRLDATKEEIIESAKIAYAHDFIMELSDGYHTMVGEKGANLSGGQKQRIAIARALLKNAPILLLDEATSALDSESEQLVQLALDRLMEGRTTLAIAHRLSTIEAADEIYVLQEGKVVEKGKHRDLISVEGTYKHLYDLQIKGHN
ncbi:ABC transporter ATP-binding protein [Proteiniborus sp. MB09-C3]|uniref:ABC transporter ATP-binding protein n=1 Tax=Proteiniborus sp. MB09-C3 TaxID=3050072 RepID=UPI002552A60A|nr:ABC transporter ATP-binding protein [Proteiniborus sp. MB09-C3]WIV12473.1 ABC transporter ATP-binding protein [Proteiniborus sp. MB09-C3]